jgi:PhnB protein
MAVKAIPDGFHTVTPYLLVNGAGRLIEFCQKAFDAEEVHRSSLPGGMVMHALVRIGDSMIMVADARPEAPARQSAIYLYVPDTDAVYQQAIAAGGHSLMEPAVQFYGDRNAGVTDPTGTIWWIGTHVEDISQEELARRFQGQSGAKH